SWVALGAAFGPAVLTRCLGWRVRGGAVLLAMLAGFIIAVGAYNVPGPLFDVVEKWASWTVGLFILFMGRQNDG
ncbi:MAG: hypothetical protein WBG08_06815, partial [Litorimonas sp.]